MRQDMKRNLQTTDSILSHPPAQSTPHGRDEGWGSHGGVSFPANHLAITLNSCKFPVN